MTCPLCDTLNRLIDAQVSDLGQLCDDLRADGLPQNWVDDAPNIPAAKAQELADIVDARRAEFPAPEPQWVGNFRALLKAQS